MSHAPGVVGYRTGWQQTMIAYQELGVTDRREILKQTPRAKARGVGTPVQHRVSKVLKINKQEEQHIYRSRVFLKGYDVKLWLKYGCDKVMQKCPVRRDAHPKRSHDFTIIGLAVSWLLKKAHLSLLDREHIEFRHI